MQRQQLAHILRAASLIAGDDRVLVVGSQAILGTFDEDDLPSAATASIEADIAFFSDEDRSKADQVEGAIGELSTFHQSNGYYAEGVHIDTLTLPTGWRGRVIGWDLQSSAPARPAFLNKHDLAVAKLAAGREKDLAFVAALATHRLIDLRIVNERAGRLPSTTHPTVSARIQEWIVSMAQAIHPSLDIGSGQHDADRDTL